MEVEFDTRFKHPWSMIVSGPSSSGKTVFTKQVLNKSDKQSYRHAWSDGGEMYLKKAKAWADAYYKSPRHEYVMAFMGCHFHGCQTCFDLSTMNTHLNKSMGDLYRETMRWIARVTNSGYMISVMWECEWDNLVKENSEIKEHVESYSLSSPLTPREALYGGRCETFSLHASCTDTSVIEYVDVQSLYPYVCKNKPYPIGHPRCLIGPDLRKFGMDVNKFEGLVKCKVLPPRGLHIPLLPSHINKKLMFVLCRKCAETENQSICNHSVGDRSLSGTWVSVELQKAVQLGYTLLKVYEVWQYDTVTKYDPSTGDGGLFAQYMNTFMKIKMEASGYPSHCDTDQEKNKYIERVRVHEGITLCPDDISFNAGRRTVAKLCLNNIWGPKNYAIRTTDGKLIVKVKGFTLNYVASNQLNFDVMKDMAISDEQHSIKIVGTSQIKKDLKRRQINTLPSSKSYKRIFLTNMLEIKRTIPVYHLVLLRFIA